MNKIYNFLNRGDVGFTLIVISMILFFKWAFWLVKVSGK
jgi:hypothetical protein